MATIITVRSSRKAPLTRKAYAARVTLRRAGGAGPVQLDREFLPRLKVTNGQYGWAGELRPGDVIETRRMVWDHDRKGWVGGMCYIVHDGGGVRFVGHDEAVAFLAHPRLGALASDGVEAVPPAGIEIVHTDD